MWYIMGAGRIMGRDWKGNAPMTHADTLYYIEGKQARLNNIALADCPYIEGSDVTMRRHDWRCGWRVADSNKKHNVDWSDAFILR